MSKTISSLVVLQVSNLVYRNKLEKIIVYNGVEQQQQQQQQGEDAEHNEASEEIEMSKHLYLTLTMDSRNTAGKQQPCRTFYLC